MTEFEIPVIVNQSLQAEPGPLHENGWRRTDRWQYSNGGQWGDDAIAGFTCYYEKPGTDLKAEISYFVGECQTTNQPEVVDALNVEMYWEVFRRDGDDGDTIDIESGYDFGSVLYYYTWESAWKEAERLGKMDDSHTFMI